MLSRRSWLIVAAVAFVLLVGHVLGICGPEQGSEFSPDRFRTRSYLAYRWGPILFPRFDEERESAISRYLLASGHLESEPKQIRWVHLFRTHTGLASLGCYWGGEPSMMLHELEESTDRLLEWSDNEPELAKAFWSQIVEWVREEKYEEVYELLHFFAAPTSMEELEACFEEHERRMREWE